jgi:Spy/CpxP family protein refolding chaperone
MHSPSSSGQPYAGEQQRQIKALSGQDIQAYENGQGHGFAKAAELNGYPGPLHTLEFANELKLSEAQRTQSQALLTQHKAEARRLGAELIEAERALDQAFASRSINTDMLNQFTRAAGEKLAQLRAEHLQTHLAQTALLTPQQIERYKALRGYGSATPLHPGMQHNLQHHPMMEMNHGQHH